MKKKILIIGYGSIGKRHAKILKKIKEVSKIYILTNQSCRGFIQIRNINKIKDIDPDYIVISSKTNDHYKHLKFLENNLSDKIILVEKPLFKNFTKLKIYKNQVFVGYNLRYHPILIYIKNFIKYKKIYSVNINCQSYLPSWRKNINYSNSNSARKKYGGGVLLELSHELDYIQWIFKKISKVNYAVLKKVSNLDIDTEDYASIEGKTSMSVFSLNLNFFSLKSIRKIIINGKDFTLKGDLINNKLKIFEKNKVKNKKIKIDKDYTYRKQHESLLNRDFLQSCSYKEGIGIMSVIDKIKGVNKI